MQLVGSSVSDVEEGRRPVSKVIQIMRVYYFNSVRKKLHVTCEEIVSNGAGRKKGVYREGDIKGIYSFAV